MTQTVVLNADYTYLNTVNWKRGLKLLLLEKAEALKESDHTVCNADKTYVFKIPLVLKLVYMVKTIYRNKIPYSRRNIFIRDGYSCQYCGTKNRLSIDHVIPSSKGGKTKFTNCVACCVTCNISKGDRTPTEANMRLRKTPHDPTVMEFLVNKMKNTGAYQFLKDIGVY